MEGSWEADWLRGGRLNPSLHLSEVKGISISFPIGEPLLILPVTQELEAPLWGLHYPSPHDPLKVGMSAAPGPVEHVGEKGT